MAEYEYKYKDKTDALAKELGTREFNYNVNSDELYQMYKDAYTKNGQRAMQDTMAKASAMTGGYGNSYAAVAGQQAYNGYMDDLNDKIPELQALAYDMWEQKGKELQNKYDYYSGLEAQEYTNWLKANDPDAYAELTETKRERDYSGYAAALSGYASNWERANYLDTLVSSGALSTDEAMNLLADNSVGGLLGIGITQDDSDGNWKVIDDGGANGFWGINNNAKVEYKMNNKTYTYTMKELKKALIAEGMDKEAAEKYVIKLQGKLGIK